jgi:hypothetical protein
MSRFVTSDVGFLDMNACDDALLGSRWCHGRWGGRPMVAMGGLADLAVHAACAACAACAAEP